jgi:thioesterase domain-containing protein
MMTAGDVNHGTRVLADPRLGWRDFALGGLDVLRVAGGHETMLAEPHVQDLARQLTALLDPINSSAESTAER